MAQTDPADEGGALAASADGFLLGPSPDGALFGTTAIHDAEAARLSGPAYQPRGTLLAPTDGADTGALLGPSIRGGLLGLAAPGFDDLLGATDGFGFVVEPVPSPGTSPINRLFAESASAITDPDIDTGTDTGTLDGISLTLEASAMSGAKVDMAAEPALYRMPLGDAALGYAGRRLFSGRVMNVEGSTGDESATAELHGPVSRLQAGGEDVSYAGVTFREAIREFYGLVAERTRGRVGGVVETPRPDAVRADSGADVIIPANAPFESSGTLKGILDELHSKSGMTYVVRHGARGDAFLESFVPGSGTPREATWIPDRDVTPKLSLEGYATGVVIRGAWDDARARYYQASVSVSDAEARATTGGERITYRPPPDDALKSDMACEAAAESALAERRGQFQMSGSVPASPAPVEPGRVYRVPSMDEAAPEPLTPVSLVLRQADYSFSRGERSMTLSFESQQGIAGLLRRAGDGPNTSLSRRIGGVAKSADRQDAYSGAYPHAYAGAPPQSALSLDGVDDYLDIPVETLDGMGASGGTMTIQLRGTFSSIDPGARRVFGADHSAGNGSEFRTYGDGWVMGNGTENTPTYPIGDFPDDQWFLFHVGWSYDPGVDQTTIYVGREGSWLASDTIPGTAVMPDVEFAVGRWRNSNLPADIDDIRVYGRRLTETDLASVDAGETLGDERAHYPLDAGYGDVARDASGNGLDATLIGGPAWLPEGSRQ